MPEGDSILWVATRIRPVLEGHVPDEIEMPAGRRDALRGTPGRERWPARLRGRRIERIDTHGKNLFLRFEGDLVLHSHLRMTGSWAVIRPGQRWRRAPSRAWIVFHRGESKVVEFDGPVLELMTESRSRFDLRLAALGPDILAPEFDYARYLARLRADDPTRGVGDAVLDQHTVAGIGNIWKSEGCWEARVNPWRAVREVSDDEAVAIIDGARPRMLNSGTRGPQYEREKIYRHVGQPCPRCGTKILSRGQGEANRTTYWCPGCQR